MQLFDSPIPVAEFTFPEPGPEMFELVCKNHPQSRYLTKNPYSRSLHYTPAPEHFFEPECTCPFTDLVVVGKD